MTCTGTEMTKIPFITISLCVSPSHFSLYVPNLHILPLHVLSLCNFLLLITKMVFLEICQPSLLPFPFHTACLPLSLFASFFFFWTSLLFIHYFILALFSPFATSYVTKEQNTNNKKVPPFTQQFVATVIAASGRITAICIIVCNYGGESVSFICLLDKLRASQVRRVPVPAWYKLVLDPNLICHFSLSIFRWASQQIIIHVLLPCKFRESLQ